MNERITDFLDDVCSHIKYKKIHHEIRAELTEHILEAAEDIGVEQAVLQMGNSFEIGENLNQQHKPKTEWSIIGLIAAITAIGGIAMYASSHHQGYSFLNFSRYLILDGIGILAMLGIYFFDYTKLKKFSLPIYCMAMIMIGMSLITGDEVNGRSFLSIAGINLSSEYAVVLFVIAFAGFVEKYHGQGFYAIIKLGLWGIFSFIAMITVSNTSGMVVLAITYSVLVLVAVVRNDFGGSKKSQSISLFSFGIASLFCVFSITPNQQVISDSWFAVSQWFGGMNTVVSGREFLSSMPAMTTDYVLINIILIFGWAVGITLLATITLFIIRIFITSKRIKNDYGFYLSLSAGMALSAQFTINILLNFNLIPLTGMSMPFVSYGGTGYIVNMVLVGTILAVWRRNNLLPKTQRQGQQWRQIYKA
ncbi:cell division protein FtsW, lipid II flippase [Sporobacter termitidis DSM 10068]|uniref:Cell division protein FtsW, lipid II flippase n=1 Tax=Sporobacter termitidis DSM 10068 TaxID=1123282 RepID=A0A1M5U5Y9_9FIRM|nr:FtsW/RodA/SpoVE family cell cycle protein [Sporobacter termitidis]SHH58310.1 cell division protein FtsW, lipid II flippase [Sporobacter termitidis DSM 10068]